MLVNEDREGLAFLRTRLPRAGQVGAEAQVEGSCLLLMLSSGGFLNTLSIIFRCGICLACRIAQPAAISTIGTIDTV